MHRHFAALALALLPAPLIAACPAGEAQVFSCTTETEKAVHVCQGADAISYHYGRAGHPPEIIVPEKNAGFHWGHSEGTGGAMDDLYFRRGQVSYVLSYQDAADDPENRVAHLAVAQQGKEDRYIECDPATIRFNPKAIKATPRELTEGTPSR